MQFRLLGKALVWQLWHLVIWKVHEFQLSIKLKRCINSPGRVNNHSVWKSQKKSHSTFRAKRAYILSRQKFIKKALNCLFSFIQFWLILTVFENHRKSLIQHFLRAKVHQICQKWSTLASFLKTWSLGSNSVTRHFDAKIGKF